jgi:tetratricopeptide (TPR) repeat protein
MPPSGTLSSGGELSCYSMGMRKLTILLGLSGLLALATTAGAQEKKSSIKLEAKGKAGKDGVKADASAEAKGSKGGKDAKDSKDSAPQIGDDGVRRDPKGVKGISPYLEQISKGDRAYVARDFEGAISAYREAIKLDPERGLGHYRVGSAQLAKGDQKEAEAAWVNGLRFTGRDTTLKAQLLFALADLRERQKNNDDAIGRWKDYSKAADEDKAAVTYPATATERVTRNEAWKKALASGDEVKARIAKRLKEADEASRKSAADPKNK